MLRPDSPRRAPSFHAAARPGSTFPVVVVMLIVLVGMVAFAIDIGYIAHARTELQRSADAGALAGKARLDAGGTTAQARQEARAFVLLNQSVITNVPDADIQLGVYDWTAAAGSRFTTTAGSYEPNSVRVTLRRDGATNPRLNLFFARAIGRADNAVTARATVWTAPGLGVTAGAELIPYVAQVDYFNAAAGYPARADTAPGFEDVSPAWFSDDYVIGNVGTTPTAGHDGVKELILFDSGGRNTPGNWGSVDLGSASNGTPELIRQLINGPNASDFAIMNSGGKLAADGSLQAPVALGGDTGISNGTKAAWDLIVGQNKIIPLYATVSGNGNNTSYTVVGFAGVRIVAVDLTGNPKQVWVQPTSFYSQYVTPTTPGGVAAGSGMKGVRTPPKLVMP